jgi:aerobic-type carbon monoxide dehydrogenase small subunit (CoxS/CutS family)
MDVELEINGEWHHLATDPTRRVVDVLRDDLGLTGTKVGCAEGACGACAVLLDGRSVASCLLLVGQVVGRSVTTIEGLSRSGPTALQEAFVEEDALQCGYCTPGQIVTATALLTAVPQPTPEEIRSALAGNICRCGAYPKIERAILRAAAASPESSG